MPYMLICAKDDGTVHVNAFPGDAPPDMLADAQPVADLEEAARMVPGVLGAEEPAVAGEEGEEAAQPGAEMPAQGDTGMEPMQAGFNRAKKGY